MEEILASIRRILNDDDTPAEPADAEGGATADDDVLVLDESMLVSEAESMSDAADPEPDHQDPIDLEPVSLESEDPAPAGEESVHEEPAMPEAVTVGQEMEAAPYAAPAERSLPASDLLGAEAAAAAASSVGNLVRTLAAGRSTQVYGGGPTLEDMVRAELRPLLRDWLDTYLPPLVERLVRTEIERVVAREVP